MSKVVQWCREWYVTLRYGSRLTKAGRELQRNLKDGPDAYVLATPPGAAVDCLAAGCRWGGAHYSECECR